MFGVSVLSGGGLRPYLCSPLGGWRWDQEASCLLFSGAAHLAATAAQVEAGRTASVGYDVLDVLALVVVVVVLVLVALAVVVVLPPDTCVTYCRSSAA